MTDPVRRIAELMVVASVAAFALTSAQNGLAESFRSDAAVTYGEALLAALMACGYGMLRQRLRLLLRSRIARAVRN